ncbi:CRISPR-associated helicase/endonuclease Cas3 [Nocardiopsis terrae]|uniref:CRISPR-associated endonuclease/helicase Cas3 n=1 Tax=Nocardiopsis terrae TaxID=372655 RepID=A0ABR9HIV2_9ACTN|nr:CRISPR-associated helicase Cas3' [Nocardiopsis terrae]MBE1458775.1 CRISPR-associated endonuclease/helicase Cas3 [Nocardiopsis terrae]GHC86238.1 CRISPR-associated helicase/endonuclease Cas3 [Nocardiopsis terrae]
MTAVPPDTPSYFDLRLWAKERGLHGQRYPYVCHALDSVAAALEIWDACLPQGLRHRISTGLGVAEPHARSLIAFWAGCHDTGKLVRHFQEQVPTDLAAYPTEPGEQKGHALVTAEWLTTALPKLGYTDDEYVAALVAQLLGGHHGVYPAPLDEFRDPFTGFGFAQGLWEEQRERAMLLAHELSGAPAPPSRLETPAAALICGLVILADWLVSQEHFILEQLRTPPADGSRASLRGHYERSRAALPALVTSAGLGPLTVSPATFTESFPNLTTPNGLQESLARHLPKLCTEGGLVLITAPPGEGKTEAALHTSDLLGKATGRDGRFVALPTMATADHMHTRLREYATRRATTSAPLALLHSMAWLNPDYAPAPPPPGTSTVLSGTRENSGSGAVRSAFDITEWLLGNKRGLLASWSVGTIDQALMAALPSRHNAVRMFGLAGKVVVIDEVHSVDPYMQTLLERLLHWLGAFGTPVVLLSATVHHSTANALVEAYLQGSRGRKRRRSEPRPVPSIQYPGWLHVHPGTGAVSANPEPVPTTERRPLTVDLAPVPLDGGRADRAAVLHEQLAPLVEEGGCAAVICTTVAEAQATRDLLAEWFAKVDAAGGRAPELHLLHARFPQEQRTAITDQIITRFGKEGAEQGKRPESAVVVATQVIEQSLDLDVDLLVTDLAPVGLLLQRAGRCWRHEHLGTVARPPWSRGPRMAVLVPAEEDSAKHLPRSWGFVYPPSLLMRTHNLLRRRASAPVRVPEDVQTLVDDLHDDETLIEDVAIDIRRLGEEMALRAHGRNAVIPTVKQLGDDLHPLTAVDFELGEHFLATRFGADSVRVLCCYEDRWGRRWLDSEQTRPLPEPGPRGRVEHEDLRAVISRTIPLRADHHTQPPLAEANRVPESWAEEFHLRDLVMLVHGVADDGTVTPARLGERALFLSTVNGLEEAKEK